MTLENFIAQALKEITAGALAGGGGKPERVTFDLSVIIDMGKSIHISQNNYGGALPDQRIHIEVVL